MRILSIEEMLEVAGGCGTTTPPPPPPTCGRPGKSSGGGKALGHDKGSDRGHAYAWGKGGKSSGGAGCGC